MTVTLNFGVSGFVAVQDTNGRDLYRRSVNSKKEAQQWIETNKVSVRGWGILKSSFVPVRTDNCVDLSKDLFLPTFINHVLKIKNLFLRVIASIFAIPWDVITLAFRLITLPIRICYKLNPATLLPKLPVQSLIDASSHFEEAMKKGSVHLVAHVDDIQVTKTVGEREGIPPIPNQAASAAESLPFEAVKNSYDTSCEVLLKEFPCYQADSQLSNSTEHFMRSLPDGVWNSQSSSSHNQSARICSG